VCTHTFFLALGKEKTRVPSVNQHSLHNDQELLALIAQGNENAFNQIFDHYWLPLCNAAYKRLQNKEWAEDIVQNIFIRLWLRRESLEIENLSVYLFTAVRYGVLDHITRKKDVTGFYEPFALLLQEKVGPDELLLAKELLDLANAYAATLPEKRREIFLLHINRRLSTKEIAGELGISQKTVQNQLNTALKGLQGRIAPVIMLIISSRF
jgi:RNA polymerase sigma-70 factor (family 1)